MIRVSKVSSAREKVLLIKSIALSLKGHSNLENICSQVSPGDRSLQMSRKESSWLGDPIVCSNVHIHGDASSVEKVKIQAFNFNECFSITKKARAGARASKIHKAG